MDGEAFPSKIPEYALGAIEAGYHYARYALAVGASALAITGVQASLETPVAKADCVLDTANPEAFADCVYQEATGGDSGNNEQPGPAESTPPPTEEPQEAEEPEEDIEESETAPPPKPSENQKPPKKKKKPKAHSKKKSHEGISQNINPRNGQLRYDYNQGQAPWGNAEFRPWAGSGQTYASSGCGPTAFAIVASNLLDRRITPSDVGRQFGRRFFADGGTIHGMMDTGGRELGLRTEFVGRNMNKVKKALKAGGLAIALARQGGHFAKGDGHFIVLSMGKEGQEYHATDPNGKNDNKEKRAYSANFLLSWASDGGHVEKIWTYNSRQANTAGLLASHAVRYSLDPSPNARQYEVLK